MSISWSLLEQTLGLGLEMQYHKMKKERKKERRKERRKGKKEGEENLTYNPILTTVTYWGNLWDENF